MSSTIITEFIKALDEEIAALKRGKGGSIVKIFNGRFLRQISGLFVYIFNLENFLAVLDDSPAEIEIRGNKYSAQILLTQGLEVQIGIEHFCGKNIPEAKLQTNLWYLLELLKKKFGELQSASSMITGLSEALFNNRPIVEIEYEDIVICRKCGTRNRIKNRSPSQTLICGRCKYPIKPHYSASSEPPNQAQKVGIESSFFSRLAVIWGPPGTGKTKTIAQAIESHLNAGRRVLLVSHANAAVDEALEDVAKQLKPTSFYNDGKLVRLGIPQPSHLDKLTEKYPLVLLDKIAAKLGESLSEEKSALEAENSRLQDILGEYESASQALQNFRALSSALDALGSEMSGLTGQLGFATNELTQAEELQTKNRIRLREAQSSGKVKRFFSGRDPAKIQREIDQLSITIDSQKRLRKEISDRIHSLKQLLIEKGKESERASEEATKALNRLGISPIEMEKKKKDIASRRDTILARLGEINQQLDESQKKILSEAHLIATTLTKTFVAKQFPDTLFDVLILDEASMAPLPHLYWALTRCRGYVTIVGDFLQLPPICISEEGMAKKWLGRSIFDVLGIRGVKEAVRDHRVTLLDVQYRMACEISAIPNRFIYQGALKDDPTTINRRSDDGISRSPLVLIDTASTNPWCSRLSSGGRFNLYNALLCCTLAKRIISKKDGKKIGIVTPYSAQARLINKIAKDLEILDYVRPSTVHRFQGGEESTIIFDTAEGSGTRVAPMLDDTKPDSDARLLLNVAVTRARNRFYLIGHTERLLSDLHTNSLLARIINYFDDNAEKITSESLVDSYLSKDFEKWADALLVTDGKNSHDYGHLYTEKNFWPIFLQDIKKSKTRLIILSPFLSVRRSGYFMDYFRSMRGRGIDIRIYTRPRNQQTGEMANQADTVIEQLRGIGVDVFERRSMHQKVAIIDDAIAWEGSLNILSHKDTEEQMRRFEGLSTVDEIIRNLDLEEEMPPGNQTEEKCPEPGCGGYLVVRKKFGRKFLGCSNYAKKKCRYTRPIGDRG